ncbi:MAG: helix-turn-helix domain-containing protein, partial [Puniceicoccales bacterium]
LPPSSFRQLDRSMQQLMRRQTVSPPLVQTCLEELSVYLDSGFQGSWQRLQRRADQRKETLDRIDRYLAAHSSAPFNLKELSTAVGISAKTLQRALVQAYGLTPREWHRCLSLNAIRKRLLLDGSHRLTLEGIASEYGFHHMGRFAGYYRDQFGELPSDTIRSHRFPHRPG